MKTYIVEKGGIIKLEPDRQKWDEWCEESWTASSHAEQLSFMDGGKRIGWDQYTENGGGIVSTVFLGMDNGFDEEEPILFETKVFYGAGNSSEQWRYRTYEEALAGHTYALQVAKGLVTDE
jgi:hypothetical protein